jgi:hypothetical protein
MADEPTGPTTELPAGDSDDGLCEDMTVRASATDNGAGGQESDAGRQEQPTSCDRLTHYSRHRRTVKTIPTSRKLQTDSARLQPTRRQPRPTTVSITNSLAHRDP